MSTATADPNAWSVVTLNKWLPELSFVRASHEFGGRLTLPRSRVTDSMESGPAVVVAPEGAFFAGRLLARIEGGVIVERDRDNEYLIPELLEVLMLGLHAEAEAATASGRAPSESVTLFADRGTPYSVLLALLFTSVKAGATRFQVAVTPTGEPDALGSDVLYLYPPKLSTPDAPTKTKHAEKTSLVMMVSRTDVRIGRHVPTATQRSAWLERIGIAEDRGPALRRIAELAQATAVEESWEMTDARVLLVGAERDVPLDLLVAALDAASGPDCVMSDYYGGRPHRCLFPFRVIHGGSPAPPELAD